MNPALQQLKDIHLPPMIAGWPVAPGWLTLYLFALVSILMLIYFIYKRQKRRRPIQFALKQLRDLQRQSANNDANLNIPAEISTLMRRTALYYFKRQEMAGLSGEKWLHFLNQTGNCQAFTSELGLLLIDAPYRPVHTNDVSALCLIVEKWLLVIAKKKTDGN